MVGLEYELFFAFSVLSPVSHLSTVSAPHLSSVSTPHTSPHASGVVHLPPQSEGAGAARFERRTHQHRGRIAAIPVGVVHTPGAASPVGHLQKVRLVVDDSEVLTRRRLHWLVQYEPLGYSI